MHRAIPRRLRLLFVVGGLAIAGEKNFPSTRPMVGEEPRDVSNSGPARETRGSRNYALAAQEYMLPQIYWRIHA